MKKKIEDMLNRTGNKSESSTEMSSHSPLVPFYGLAKNEYDRGYALAERDYIRNNNSSYTRSDSNDVYNKLSKLRGEHFAALVSSSGAYTIGVLGTYSAIQYNPLFALAGWMLFIVGCDAGLRKFGERKFYKDIQK